MALRYESNVSHADWFVTSDAPWVQLCSLGPGGFDRYCRLFHALPDGADESDADELGNVEGHLDQLLLQRLTAVLARHTGTPEDCFFGLWDGFGDIHGSPSVALLGIGRQHRSRIPGAFPAGVLDGPRVQIPHRDYILFRGPIEEAGDWPATELAPGRPRVINSPNVIWPRDRAWFVATEIDLPWTGVACTRELAEELVSDVALNAELVDPAQEVPYWRH